MPRGFLVKRKTTTAAVSAYYRRREDDRASDSGSELENRCAPVGSPDSGYQRSPTGRDQTVLGDVQLSVAVTPPARDALKAFDSPLCCSTFSGLAVCSPTELPLPPSPPPARSPPLRPPAAHDLTTTNGRVVDGSGVKTDVIALKTGSKKSRVARRITFEEEDLTSPVSGTIIRDPLDEPEEGARVCSGDIEPSLNVVDVTPEARAQLAKIDNRLGDYICRLCREQYGDAFGLAQHRCSRIVHVEYKCSECDKVFNCPANLASHRRWHKPRVPPPTAGSPTPGKPTPTGWPDAEPGPRVSPGYPGGFTAPPPATDTGTTASDVTFKCDTCNKRFRRQAYFRKHLVTCQRDASELRPYPCRLCSKPFRSQVALTKHVLQRHIGGRLPLPHHRLPPHVGLLDPHAALLDSPPLSPPAPPPDLRPTQFYDGGRWVCKYCTCSLHSSAALVYHINKCHLPDDQQMAAMLQSRILASRC